MPASTPLLILSYITSMIADVTLTSLSLSSAQCFCSIILTISPLPSFFFSDDVEVSEDTVPPGNFAVKARAALSALSSPPDKVRYLIVRETLGS